MFGITELTQPAAEPVTLAQAKQHLVIPASFTDDDALITAYITAARQYCEHYTRRAFFERSVQLTLNHFPAWDYEATVGAHSRDGWFYYDHFFRNPTIQLPKPAVQSVTSIKYVDVGGDQQTLDSSLYVLDNAAEPARLSPAPGAYWPYTMQYRPGNVQITYVAGSYGDGVKVNTCPQSIVLAMLMLIAHWYANREATSQINLTNIPLGVNAMLDTVRVDTFGLDL